jgi:hypothetical protein
MEIFVTVVFIVENLKSTRLLALCGDYLNYTFEQPVINTAGRDLIVVYYLCVMCECFYQVRQFPEFIQGISRVIMSLTKLKMQPTIHLQR